MQEHHDLSNVNVDVWNPYQAHAVRMRTVRADSRLEEVELFLNSDICA